MMSFSIPILFHVLFTLTHTRLTIKIHFRSHLHLVHNRLPLAIFLPLLSLTTLTQNSVSLPALSLLLLTHSHSPFTDSHSLFTSFSLTIHSHSQMSFTHKSLTLLNNLYSLSPTCACLIYI